MKDNKTLGGRGEDLASGYLQRKGYRILARNYRNVYGEIDIIARVRSTICFIEVKTRADDSCGSGIEAISKYKMGKISRAAAGYLTDNDLWDSEARFDVVAVRLENGRPAEIELVADAFEFVPLG